MTDLTPGELGRRMDDVVRQVGVDLTRSEARLSNLESEFRTNSTNNDQKFVGSALYARDLAETRKDMAELQADLKDLKSTLDNNRRLVLTSLVLPVVVALIVFFLTTQVNR